MTTTRFLRAIFCAALTAAAVPAAVTITSAQEGAAGAGKQTGAVAPTAAPSAVDGASRRERQDANRLSSQDLQDAVQTNLYDLIRAKRPRWMRQRGQGSISQPEAVRVYVDGSPAEGLNALRGIDVDRVASVEFLDSSAATLRLGTGHVNGAIMVRTGGRN